MQRLAEKQRLHIEALEEEKASSSFKLKSLAVHDLYISVVSVCFFGVC